MQRKFPNVTVTTYTSTSTPKLPKVEDRSFRFSFIGGRTVGSHDKPRGAHHRLPGIGTYVIDTPKDKELSARQRCFRYQEAHRGVVRSSMKSLPEIPKRCGMKKIPIVQLKDLNAEANEETIPSRPEQEQGQVQGQGQGFLACASPGESDPGGQSDGRAERCKKQDPAITKLPSQDELVTRSPLGRITQSSNGERQQNNSPVMVHGFGVRRNKPVTPNRPSPAKREFTNLTTNLPLAEPEPSPCKATDRELESQAEYRKQLTFYLSQMIDSGGERSSPKIPGKEEDLDDNVEVDDVARSSRLGLKVDYVGHTSKHQEWEGSISLGEMLINTTPDLRKRLKLDHIICREARSGKSSLGTPDMNRHGKAHAPTKCMDSENAKNSRLIKINDNNYNNYYNNDANAFNNNNLNENITTKAHNISNTNFPPISKSSSECINREDSLLNQTEIDRILDGSGQSDRRIHSNSDCAKNESTEKDRVILKDIHHFSGVDEDNEEEEVEDDEEGYGLYDNVVDEKWLHMVNTPLVESGVYDRYANVKLPPSWMQRPISISNNLK